MDACRFSNPRLTTIRQHKDRVGQLAARLLTDLI
ncbi:hypothetical protein ACFSL6_25300 [Paenibacillus thailandensis]|uniref:Uncharacterized protein n=1 Tax=Paenibacillus thailandensis TaxID=393250 RepID=A0ABW5QWL5_9BACL